MPSLMKMARSPMGATHSSHGHAKRAHGFTGGPENTLSVEASRAQASPVHE